MYHQTIYVGNNYVFKERQKYFVIFARRSVWETMTR